jgi:hypothetical protein
MKRLVKILGLAMVLSAILVAAFAGSAFAAGPNDNGTQNQGAVCPAGSGVNGDCVPNNYSNNNNHNYLTPGPHGK